MISYAKDNNWNNNYYLYVTFEGDYVTFVYDYEMDTLWIPNNIDTYKRMYEKFDTLAISDIAKTEKGKEFLVDNNLATIKHNEVEISYSHPCYHVFISNGVFSSYGEDGSHSE